MSSVRGGALLEKGLRLGLGAVRLQELGKGAGGKKKRHVKETSFCTSYLIVLLLLSVAGLGIISS